jgi:hypothetical protein
LILVLDMHRKEEVDVRTHRDSKVVPTGDHVTTVIGLF